MVVFSNVDLPCQYASKSWYFLGRTEGRAIMCRPSSRELSSGMQRTTSGMWLLFSSIMVASKEWFGRMISRLSLKSPSKSSLVQCESLLGGVGLQLGMLGIFEASKFVADPQPLVIGLGKKVGCIWWKWEFGVVYFYAIGFSVALYEKSISLKIIVRNDDFPNLHITTTISFVFGGIINKATSCGYTLQLCTLAIGGNGEACTLEDMKQVII